MTDYTKSYRAAAVILAYSLIVAAANDTVAQAVDGSKPFVGVTGMLGADAADDMCDVKRDRLQTVRYGAAVTRMDRLTSDANGCAVPVGAPGAGVTVHYIGYAEVDGVAGDLGEVFIAPGSITG